MDHSYGGGSWSMIPNIPVHSNPSTPSNQDHLFVQQQQQQFHHQQQFHQQQFNPQQQPQQFHQQQFQQQQQQQQQRYYQQQQQQQQQHHQSLASHFHLLHLVENLADAIENGTRDQHSDALVTELNSQFEKCQQLLNSISGSINAKPMTVEKQKRKLEGAIFFLARTVEEQKRKLEESEQLLNQRKDLIANYRNSIEELIKSEP